MPKFISLTQGSAEWHEWRRHHIGGSDASIIASYFLGLDWPYSSSWPGGDLYRLWMEKTGRLERKEDKDRSYGDYVDPKAHGKRTEEKARAWYWSQKKEFAPMAGVCIEHDEIPYLAASLDAFGDRPVEIKCGKEPDTHRRAKEGDLGPYFAQCQHNLFVSGAPILDFVSFYEGEGIIVPVTADEAFLEKLGAAEAEFWFWVESDTFPLVAGEITTDDPLLLELVTDYFEWQREFREHEAIGRRLKAEMARAMPAGKVTTPAGTVSLRIAKPFVRPAVRVESSLQIRIMR